MDRFYTIVGIVFVHLLFLLTEVGAVVALYFAATDKDFACLVIAVLCRIARQCLIPMWKQLEMEVWGHDDQRVSDRMSED